MREVIDILMRRDMMSEVDARDLVQQTQEEIDEALSCGASYDEIQDIFQYNLGLEPDYMIDFLM